MFIDGNDDRHGTQLQKIDGVMKDWPIELLPLSEQTTTIRVLFLGHPEQNQVSLLPQFFPCFVPTWQVPTTTSSPRRKVNQQNLLSAEL